MEERSVSLLVREILSSFSTLLRAEIRLARAEVTQNARKMSKDVIRGAIFGVIALLGVLALMAFLIIAAGDLFGGRYWLSSLLVTILFLGVGGGLALNHFRKLARDAGVPHTQRSLTDDRDLIAEKVRHITTAPRKGPERDREALR